MNPFDPDGLWLKSRLFVNRALDPEREFEEQAFWACAALELLGKSALARISPLLVANPMDDGKSLLVASGIQASEATSVQAKAVWARAAKAFKPFSEGEAKKLSTGRNDYIHAAGVGFEVIPEQAWWPSFWTQTVILLEHTGRSIEEYVGALAVPTVEANLARRLDNLAKQLEARLERSRTQLRQRRSGTLSARQTAEWNAYTPPYSRFSAIATCPACDSMGLLGGDEKLDTRIEYDHDFDGGEYDIVYVSLVVGVDVFSCPSCRLLIDDYDLLVLAKLDETFETAGSEDDIEYESEYNNE